MHLRSGKGSRLRSGKIISCTYLTFKKYKYKKRTLINRSKRTEQCESSCFEYETDFSSLFGYDTSLFGDLSSSK